MLLEAPALARRWADLLATASAVDIAVAWITNKDRVADLVKFAGMPGRSVRVLAGINDQSNDPVCLRQLHEAGALKVVIRAGPLFHPKLYLFTLPGRTVCWIGSANLTGEGFGDNTELMHEHDDDGSAALWFARTWAAYKPPTAEWLDAYEEMHRTHPPVPSPTVPKLVGPGGPLESWAGYVSELQRVDKKWIANSDGKSGVFSGITSHAGTIRLAQAIMAKDWGSLSKTEARILLGLIDDDGTDYGHLGSMQGAGIAKNVFLEAVPKNIKIRRQIQDAINELLKVPLGPGLPLMARKAHEAIPLLARSVCGWLAPSAPILKIPPFQ